MRNFLITKLRCAKCGKPLEIKMPNEVSEDVKHSDGYVEGEPGGASRYRTDIFVETCVACQEKLERPARMILEGLKKLDGGAQ